MTIFKCIIVACLMVALFVSCDESTKGKKPADSTEVKPIDSKEKVLADGKQMMKDLTAVFKGIVDVDSANAATPKVIELVKKGHLLDQRIRALKLDKEAIDKETKDDTELIKVKEEFSKEMLRIGAMEDVKKILDQAMVSR